MFKIIFLILSAFNVYGLPIDSEQKDAPWHIHLDINDLRCGGSLYKEKYVITAAHCFDAYFEDFPDDISQIKIFIGEWKIDTDPDCDEDNSEEVCDHVIKTKVADLKIHEKYDKNSPDTKHNYDIAVITLKRPPRVSDIVSSILLTEDECEDNLTGKDLIISGFGEIRPQVKANIRKKIGIKVFEHDKCLKAFQNKVYNSENHICGAGINGLATCKGDSGSGAVTQIIDGDDEETKTYIHGIVSFGSDVCGDGKPTGLLKIACFTDWINGVINPKAIKKQKTIKFGSITSASPQNEENQEGEEEDGDAY